MVGASLALQYSQKDHAFENTYCEERTRGESLRALVHYSGECPCVNDCEESNREKPVAL